MSRRLVQWSFQSLNVVEPPLTIAVMNWSFAGGPFCSSAAILFLARGRPCHQLDNSQTRAGRSFSITVTNNPARGRSYKRQQQKNEKRRVSTCRRKRLHRGLVPIAALTQITKAPAVRCKSYALGRPVWLVGRAYLCVCVRVQTAAAVVRWTDGKTNALSTSIGVFRHNPSQTVTTFLIHLTAGRPIDRGNSNNNNNTSCHAMVPQLLRLRLP